MAGFDSMERYSFLEIRFLSFQRTLSIWKDINALVQVVDADGSGMIGLFQHTALQIVYSDVVRFCEVERIAYTLGG